MNEAALGTGEMATPSEAPMLLETAAIRFDRVSATRHDKYLRSISGLPAADKVLHEAEKVAFWKRYEITVTKVIKQFLSQIEDRYEGLVKYVMPTSRVESDDEARFIYYSNETYDCFHSPLEEAMRRLKHYGYTFHVESTHNHSDDCIYVAISCAPWPIEVQN